MDVYSLACVMFEALTGTKPFVAESLAGLLYSHLNAAAAALGAPARGVRPRSTR